MDKPTFRCLYCALDKSESEATLEHAVPQFMGGAYAPEKFMLRNVCSTCNSRLGLFVDAAYAKSWVVANGLVQAAMRLYTGTHDLPLPLSCMGAISIDGLQVPDEYVAEHWIGPSGETVIWVRPHDERLYWYSGGNPIDKKQKNSIAYLFLTSTDSTRWEMGISSFKAAFKSKKLRRILCAELQGTPQGTVLAGFVAPSEEEKKDIAAIRTAIHSGQLLVQPTFNVKFDQRFIAKISLAVGYSLFGDSYLETSIASELRKGCWAKDGEVPEIRGSSTFDSEVNNQFSEIMGYTGAVTLVVFPSGSMYTLTITIDRRLPFTVELAPSSLQSQWVNPEFGYVLFLFPLLRQSLELGLLDMLLHASGDKKNSALSLIDEKHKISKDFFSRLGPTQI